MEQNEIRSWDPFVRIFHWSLVLTFTVARISGDELEVLHINAGYVVLGLVLLVVVHVIGVIVESRLNHERLIRAMLTGRKRA